LRIQVNHQHALTDEGQTGSQVDRGRGFAHTTFLIRNAKDFGHTELSKETEK